MPYKVDRSMLELNSTEEILRILREEREDYTPEAIRAFEEILESRGVPQPAGASSVSSGRQSRGGHAMDAGSSGLLVASPSDAVQVLNSVLSGVLEGKVTPDVGQAATNLVLGILRALELEYMSGGEEES